MYALSWPGDIGSAARPVINRFRGATMNTAPIPALPESDQEEWLPVFGCETHYEVSSLGRVRSIDRWILRKPSVAHPSGWRQFKPGVMLKATPGSNGYPVVSLGKAPQKNIRVHRLVLEAFVGPCPEGQECLHRDDIKSNNRLSNIRWGTHSDNQKEAYSNGRILSQLGRPKPRKVTRSKEAISAKLGQ